MMLHIWGTARWRELSLRGLLAAAYAAAMIAGYAAGIALLVWRCAPYAGIEAMDRQLDSAIRRGEIGVEQVRVARTGFETYLIAQGAGRFNPAGIVAKVWDSDELLTRYLVGWVAVFFTLGLACHIPMWAATRVIRTATRGSEGRAAGAVWRDALRVSTNSFGLGAIATMFLIGLAVVTLSDLAGFLIHVLPSFRSFRAADVRFVEAISFFFALFVVPLIIVWLAARSRIRRNPELLRKWCTRCGYSLQAHSADPSGAVCCPECGRAVAPLAAPRVGRRFVPALAALAVLLVLIATPLWSSKLEELWIAWSNSAVFRSNEIYVNVGGVIRMQYPEGTIWFRLDQVDPANGQIIPFDGGRLTVNEVILRVIVEQADPASPPGESKTIRKRFTIKVIDLNALLGSSPPPSGSAAPSIRLPMTRIATLNSGDSLVVFAVWSDTNLVVINLDPDCATSIQAVDPAMAPSFHE